MAAPNAETRLLNLQEIRTVLESNVSELAEQSGLTRQTISKIEANEPVRLTTINTVFQAVKELYGHRFEKLSLEPQSNTTYLIDFELQKDKSSDQADDFPYESWDYVMAQASWIIAKASENRETDHIRIHKDIETLDYVAQKLLRKH